MKLTIAIMTAFLLIVGCGQSSTPAPVFLQKNKPAISTTVPQPDNITEFKADPAPPKGVLRTAGTRIGDFKITRKDIENILRTWHQISKSHWEHGYSHVANEDRTGTIKLKNGTTIRWMVRPGGLATVTFENGTKLYLAEELTHWKNNAGQMNPEPRFDRIDYSKPGAYLELPAGIGNAKKIESIAAKLKGKTPEKSLRAIDRWINKNLRYDPDAAYHWRNFEQIIEEGTLGGCADHSIIFGALSRACGIPTIWVKTMDYDWIHEFKQYGPIGSWRGHVFLEVYIQNKWVLLDAQGMTLYEDYDCSSHFFPGGRYAYDKGANPYELILSVRWETWKKQTAEYFTKFDVSRLPDFGPGRDISGTSIYIIADSPIWRWVQDACKSQRYRVRKSFNTGFEIFLPQARGNILIIACVENHIVLPEKYHNEYLPITEQEMKALLKTKENGIARGQLDDQTKVIMIFGKDNESVQKAVKTFSIEETESIP